MKKQYKKNNAIIKNYAIPIILWITLLAVSFTWNITAIDDFTINIVTDRARSLFKIFQTYRLWNAKHKGVYVPVTDKTKPNPYLDDPLRDVTTKKGMKLTKINPAFMTRQVAEIARDERDILFHITSMKPIRPENRADEWETNTLKQFRNGTKEKINLLNIKTIKYYRYMAPLYVKKACLGCHTKQGYKEGDIRGGISISIPAHTLLSANKNQKVNLSIIHVALLIIGIVVIIIFEKRSLKDRKIIEQSLLDKEMLIKEIHHRTKNNLTVVHSLLNLESNKAVDKNLKRILDDSLGRIKSMSMIHERLYQVKGLESFKFSNYIKKLIHELLDTYVTDPSKIDVSIDIPDVSLNINKIIPCGLIINEIVSNSFKYAFKSKNECKLSVSLKENNENYTLIVNDNGEGLPEGFDIKNTKTLGMKIIVSFVRQLKGNLEVKTHNGTEYVITFKK